MNVLLVDDEISYMKELKEYLTQKCDKEDIELSIDTVIQPKLLLEKDIIKLYDVILLDIAMPELSGIDLASIINERKGNSDKPYIVFVTKKDELVFEALKVFPYSFVRKSAIEDLMPCLFRINDRISNNQIHVFKDGRKNIRVFFKDIIYLEKKNNYVIIHTQSGDYKERSDMSAKTKELSDFGFIRSHIGSIVNIEYIEEILFDSVRLITGDTVPLSQRYRKDFNKKYYNWFHR